MKKNKSTINFANIITYLRIVLLFIASFFILSDNASRIAALCLIIMIFILDYFDGYVARKFNCASDYGGLLDITADRVIEAVLWIIFAHLGYISVWIPIIVIARGYITDSIREYAFTQGLRPFGENSMLKGRLSHFIVSSDFMRFLYSFLKCVTFSLLVIVMIDEDMGNASGHLDLLSEAAKYLVIITVGVCILRAIPVVIEGRRLFYTEEHK